MRAAGIALDRGKVRRVKRIDALICPQCNSEGCGPVVCRFSGRKHKGNWRHGHSRKAGQSATYHSWRSMMMRCYNKNCDGYKYWGGRGITVCESWHNFANFLADMGEKPKGSSLDRIHNQRGYEPTNCRWATPSEQSLNRRSAHLLTYLGETLSVSVWARRLGCDPHVIAKRIKRGWDVAHAVTLPPSQAKDIQKRINQYADAMIRRDKEQPQWLRDLKTGAGNG
jgi:hypothetical protein